MRGRKDMNRSQGRRRRRCLLAGLLCATGQLGATSQSAWGEAPVAIAPLPLAVPFEQGGQYVQINPFCRPVTASSDEATVHAAGLIQLTPLDVLPESQVMLSSGQQFETPLTSTANGGVEFRIEAFSSPADATGEPLAYPVPLPYPVPVPMVDAETVEETMSDTADVTPADDAITFSFSDTSAADIEATLVRPQRAAVPATAATQSSPAELQPQPRARAAWRGDSEQVVHVDPPNLSRTNEPSLSGPKLARPAASNKTLLVPIQEQPGTVVTAVGSGRLPASTLR